MSTTEKTVDSIWNDATIAGHTDPDRAESVGPSFKLLLSILNDTAGATDEDVTFETTHLSRLVGDVAAAVQNVAELKASGASSSSIQEANENLEKHSSFLIDRFVEYGAICLLRASPEKKH